MTSPDTTIVPLKPESPHTIDDTTVTLMPDGSLSIVAPGGMNGDTRTTVVQAHNFLKGEARLQAHNFSMGVDRFQPDGSAQRTVYQFEPAAPRTQT